MPVGIGGGIFFRIDNMQHISSLICSGFWCDVSISSFSFSFITIVYYVSLSEFMFNSFVVCVDFCWLLELS